MKKALCIFMIALIAACSDSVIEKPDNLIEEQQMVDIIYDLSVLDAIKSQNPLSFNRYDINPKEYVYKKYKVDSLQFAKSNHYYASDIHKYKSIYERVGKRLSENKKVTDSLIKKKSGKTNASTADEPQVR